MELLNGEVEHIPKRPGEPDCTFAETTKIKQLLGWKAQISFEEGVGKMLAHINDWKDAPVWNPASIDQATEAWFRCLGGQEK